MRRNTLACGLVAVVVGLAGGCEDPPDDVVAPEVTTAESRSERALASEAVVTFGKTNVGSPFPPASGHDGSFHAVDQIRPRTTVIAVGGSVTFLVAPPHKIAIYEPGVEPEDIDLTSLVPPPPLPFEFPPLIDDPTDRIVGGSETALNTNFQTGEIEPFVWTFTEAGRYLVICEVLPHFAGAGMYAWIEVK